MIPNRNFAGINPRWTMTEDELLVTGVTELGEQWYRVAQLFTDRNAQSCQSRWKILTQTNSRGGGKRVQQMNKSMRNKILNKLNSEDVWDTQDKDLLEVAYQIYNGDWRRIGARFAEKSLAGIKSQYTAILANKAIKQKKVRMSNGNGNGTGKKQEESPKPEYSISASHKASEEPQREVIVLSGTQIFALIEQSLNTERPLNDIKSNLLKYLV